VTSRIAIMGRSRRKQMSEWALPWTLNSALTAAIRRVSLADVRVLWDELEAPYMHPGLDEVTFIPAPPEYLAAQKPGNLDNYVRCLDWVAGGERGAILEDDVMCAHGWLERAEDLLTQCPQPDRSILSLHTVFGAEQIARGYERTTIETDGRVLYRPVSSWNNGAQGTFLSGACAAALGDYCRRVLTRDTVHDGTLVGNRLHQDLVIDWAREEGFALYLVIPCLVLHLHEAGSTWWHGRPAKWAATSLYHWAGWPTTDPRARAKPAL
jgi:hypothetical protein